MREPTGPDLTVILPTSGAYRSIRRTVAFLRSQTVAARLELVIVAPNAAALDLVEADLAAFWGHRVAEIRPGGSIASIAYAYAAGVRAARAHVVAFAEDHSFPDAGWAAALIEAHRRPLAAVGPVVRNGNPDTLVSWCDFLIGYGPWAEPHSGGEMEMLPGHNSSYKRDRLLDYGDRLEAMLAAESVLHAELRARGERLHLEPGATTAHINFSVLASWLPVQFMAGRVYGASRAMDWGPMRRLAFAGGAPLIPLVRFARIIRFAARARQAGSPLIRLAPLLLLGLVMDALGQMTGYARGAGAAPARLTRFEFDRVDHITERDRQLLSAQPVSSGS